jgi:hypothetical protein
MVIGIADPSASYESLPPNFSLMQNMTAGAFAGIAEHCASTFPTACPPLACPVLASRRRWLSFPPATCALTTRRSVPDRCHQGEHATTARRHTLLARTGGIHGIYWRI